MTVRTLHRAPTDEERQALDAYARENGPRWRERLILSWHQGLLAEEKDGDVLARVCRRFGADWVRYDYAARPLLTEAQRMALLAIQGQQVLMSVAGGRRRVISAGLAPTVIGMVVANGWARWPRGPVAEQMCELTDRGLAVMAAARPKPVLYLVSSAGSMRPS